jgi:hypothetical protein
MIFSMRAAGEGSYAAVSDPPFSVIVDESGGGGTALSCLFAVLLTAPEAVFGLSSFFPFRAAPAPAEADADAVLLLPLLLLALIGFLNSGKIIISFS